MSQVSAEACAARMTIDQTFRDEIAGAADDAARLDIINAAGFTVTADDRDVIVNALAVSDGEVSDAQLAVISGGVGLSPDFVFDPNYDWKAHKCS